MWQKWQPRAICPGLNLRFKNPEITGVRGRELHRVCGEESVWRVTFIMVILFLFLGPSRVASLRNSLGRAFGGLG